MRQDERRLAASIGAALLLAALAGLVWLAAGSDGAAAPKKLRSTQLPTSVPFGLAPKLISKAEQPMRAERSTVTDRHIEVCGLGHVAPPAENELEPAALRAATDAMRPRLIAWLLAKSDDQSRAMAYAVQMSVPDREYEAALAAAVASCQTDKLCSLEDLPRGPQNSSLAAARDSLARLATGTSDPGAYTLAFYLCRGLGRFQADSNESACSQISAQRWAAIEPGNAVPWLHLAEEAQAAGDAAGVAAAVYQVANATSFNGRFGQSAAIVMGASVEGVGSDASKGLIAVYLLGMDAARALPGYKTVSDFCSTAALRDANRSQLCNSLAETMVSRGGNLLDFSIGRRIGERVGWSAERVARLGDEQQALLEAMTPGEDEMTNFLTCGALASLRQRMTVTAADGEFGFARRVIAGSGVTIDERIVALRARRAANGRAAAASAAASAAGS